MGKLEEKYVNKDLLDEDSLKHYRDLKNSLDTAKEEKALEIAKNGLEMGLSIQDIMKLTELTEEQIESLK